MQTELIDAYEAFQISTQKERTKAHWDRLFTEALQALNKEIIDAASKQYRKCLFKIPDGVAYDRLHNRLTHRGYSFELVSQDDVACVLVKW